MGRGGGRWKTHGRDVFLVVRDRHFSGESGRGPAMLELTIGSLRLSLLDVGWQERRVGPIVTRAVELLSERLGERRSMRGRPGRGPPPANLDLRSMSDEQAADHLAGLMLEALALKLSV